MDWDLYTYRRYVFFIKISYINILKLKGFWVTPRKSVINNKMKEVGNYFDRYDLFAQDIPKFHLDGQKKIGTSVGCCLSVLLVTMIAAYSGIRGHMVLTGDRPTISSFTV